MKFEDKFKFYGAILGLIGVFSLSYLLITYKFKDCRKVGHTVLYCLMDLK